ncbi:MAG TPA: flagellar type III secretion system pore protein FliP [Actinomycetales bacterium]|nr:flagellar type III secretion system pore protein FliP [Actinomycetales bacterium]
MTRLLRAALVAFVLAVLVPLGVATAAAAHAVPSTHVVATGQLVSSVQAVGTPTTPGGAATSPRSPRQPSAPASPDANRTTVSVDINGPKGDGKPSSSVVIILAVTALSVAPALLLLTTSFTKIFVVLSLTRNALGLQSTPPTQVLAGLALFLTLFVMSPVLTQVNHDGVQPYLKGQMTQSQAFDAGVKPLRQFMVSHTRSEELALITKAAQQPRPKNAASVPLSTLVPAFVLSELRSAFVIGFVVFVPFLVIDIVVAAVLMSMGMMMLPPVTISLPFKILLFVLVDGWGLIVQSLVASYR